jgi:hypothetical protein
MSEEREGGRSTDKSKMKETNKYSKGSTEEVERNK